MRVSENSYGKCVKPLARAPPQRRPQLLPLERAARGSRGPMGPCLLRGGAFPPRPPGRAPFENQLFFLVLGASAFGISGCRGPRQNAILGFRGARFGQTPLTAVPRGLVLCVRSAVSKYDCSFCLRSSYLKVRSIERRVAHYPAAYSAT